MKKQSPRLLAQGCEVDNNTWETGLNNNDIIIGTSGCGKTRGYVIPNILQCNENMIVAAPKGGLEQQVSHILEQDGYMVYSIDFTDCAASWGYNPLAYIRKEGDSWREQDIMTVAACLVPVESREPFWDLSARMRLESLIGYVMDFLPPEEHDLVSVVKLFQSGKADRIFQEVEEIAPDCFCAVRYRMSQMVKQADKTEASIQGILAERLACCSFEGVTALFRNPRQLFIPDLGRGKAALFLKVSDVDRSMDRLVGLFYTQALQVLCDTADRSPGHRLATPVRFYLDDFAAGYTIPDFDKTTSVIRSREISVSVILQSVSQLEAMYGPPRAATILNNADHILYLGGQDVGTAGFISVKANKPTSTILQMPLSQAWLFTRGEAPRLVEKYNLKSHPKYFYLPEYQPLSKGTKKQPQVSSEADSPTL